MTIKTPKKLIEVALPLDDINVAAAREKSIRHGHLSTLEKGVKPTLVTVLHLAEVFLSNIPLKA